MVVGIILSLPATIRAPDRARHTSTRIRAHALRTRSIPHRSIVGDRRSPTSQLCSTTMNST